MELIGNSNDRQIYYTNAWSNQSWFKKLPTDNWLVFSIGQSRDAELYSIFADKCIENNVLWLCAAGENCEFVHDIFDETVIAKKIEKGESIDNPDDFENSPLTTWHNNFSEGFWFAVAATHDELKSIDKIVCVDFTSKGVKGHLINLIEKINQSWLPSDEEFEEPIYDK